MFARMHMNEDPPSNLIIDPVTYCNKFIFFYLFFFSILSLHVCTYG